MRTVPGAVFALVLAFLPLPGSAAAEAAFPLVDTDLEWFRSRPLEVRWGADPFVSKAPSAAQAAPGKPLPPAFLLSAVILGGEEPAAVVDGEVVHRGGEIRGYRVERIERDRVMLSGSTGRLTVPLLPLYRLHQTLP